MTSNTIDSIEKGDGEDQINLRKICLFYFILFYFILFYFIYLFWLCRILVVACRIFLAACGLFTVVHGLLSSCGAGFSLVVAHGLQSAGAQ